MANETINKKTSLANEESFSFLSGLWTGKKPPYTKAVVIRNTNFSNDGKVDYSNIAVLDVEIKQLEKRKLQKGDIIIEKSGGGPKQPVGRVVYFEKEDSEIDYSFSNFTSVIRVINNQEFDSRFVFYFLFNFYSEGKTEDLQRRTTGIRNLDVSGYKEAVTLPEYSKSEQKAIARVLTTVQNAIARQEELIAKLKELKRSMMHHLFTHGTKGEKTKMTEIGEIPEIWKICKIKDFGHVITGNTPPTKNLAYYGGSYNLVSPADLIDEIYVRTSHKKITDAGLRVARTVPKNSVFVGCIGNVGKIGISKDEVTAFNQQINAVVCNEKFNFLFVYYLLTFYRSVLESKSAKVTLPILNKSNFENIEFFAPELKEQENIATALYSVDKKIESTHSKLSVYQTLFKTLLHELMSGERRIKKT